ncbi:MAG: arginase family protein [Rhodospirillales bacterium]|jgi:agmatinase|nr:arginase family protein [Rhodospirillales bacterium]MDP7652748.1 arginase family protein [Rhodospirillales bacterium]
MNDETASNRPGASIFDAGLFVRTAPFMGVANDYDLTDCRLAVLGIPYDWGVHPVRIGSRLGPAAIREQSALVRPYQPPMADYDPRERLGVVDCGDARVTPSRIDESFEAIESAMLRILECGALTLTMGGDGMVTLPQLRALHKHHPDLVALHFDAHTDTAPTVGQHKYTTGTTFTRAAEEGVVDAANSMHIGPRGSIPMQGIFEHTRDQGYELITGGELIEQGIPAMLEHIHARLAGRPVQLVWDMDVFDPSCAPGVCTPTWGGLTAREGLAIIQGLAGLNFVGFDVNTVSPPHDVGGMSAFLAATMMRECMVLACHTLGLHEG